MQLHYTVPKIHVTDFVLLNTLRPSNNTPHILLGPKVYNYMEKIKLDSLLIYGTLAGGNLIRMQRVGVTVPVTSTCKPYSKILLFASEYSGYKSNFVFNTFNCYY